MGMELELFSPGVHNSCKSGKICAQKALLPGEELQRLGGCPEKGLVADPLMTGDHIPEFLGDSEGDQEVRTGHLTMQLGFEPLTALVVPALRAVPVAA